MKAQRQLPELLATVVNTVLVFFLPWIALAVFSNQTQPTVTVHPPGWSPVLSVGREFFQLSATLWPFAGLAGWRTWIHATRWRTGIHTYRGVIEAGACGFGLALIVLVFGVVTRGGNPIDAFPYVLAYGFIATVVGLTVGVVLQAAAMIVLAVSARFAA